MVISYIGLGSNLGDRQYYINTAIKRIRLLTGTRVTKISTVIETAPEPKDIPPQGPYLNCVVEIRTNLSPHELLKRLQKIEYDLGRIRTVKNEPRNIDLDILLYGNITINEDSLCIPHPRMFEREFVMKPLMEIAPQIVKKLKRKTKRIVRDKMSKRR